MARRFTLDRRLPAPAEPADGLADSERLKLCEAAACGCRPMVERAYRELIDRGQPDGHALESATVVLRWHHPEVPAPEAVEIVARWVAGEPMH